MKWQELIKLQTECNSRLKTYDDAYSESAKNFYDEEKLEFNETHLVEVPKTVKYAMRKLIDKAILLSIARAKQVLQGYQGVESV